MKLVEKIAERIGSFSSVFILLLICFSYLRYQENQISRPEQARKEIKAIDKKIGADTELQPCWIYKD